MRDTSKLPAPGPIILALVAEIVVVLSVFGAAVWIITRMSTP
jgi:hypothetical protein